MTWKRISLSIAVWIVASFGFVSWLLYGVTDVVVAFERAAPGRLKEAEDKERQARRDFLSLVDTNPAVFERRATNRQILTNQITIGTNGSIEITSVLREGVTESQASAAQVNVLTNWAAWLMASQPIRSASNLRQRIWIVWGVWTFVPVLGFVTWRIRRSPSAP